LGFTLFAGHEKPENEEAAYKLIRNKLSLKENPAIS
jgi:hypothetical protein